MTTHSAHPLALEHPVESAAVKPASPEPRILEHEYDGIKEYDNPLPRWWLWIWAGSIIFSIGYFFHYHVSHNGTSVQDDYLQDMAAAREQEAKQSLAQPVSEDSLGKLMADPALMTDAKALFGMRCSPCHGDHAQGIIGPNLTDNYWIHGKGTLTDIYGVVDGGVAAKGMPAWGRMLTPIELRKVVAFVGTQRGKNLPGKAPEGDPLP
ncbi:MAG TPA: cbb3-type cytochrome c oxidase N-terminal domain-containing protein [Polyangiaceae bacterium]|jgi:cytochrome c oxidase cbb3-type subunit 3|nr:cbb3-type cytochrome c oxidase N-terminal domain-containing protein [Polyangiaceae bacterium]